MSATAGLNHDIILVLSILGFTGILFLSSFIRVDTVAIIVLGLIGVTKLLPPELLFLGFSSEAVMSLIAIMIISAGLENAGFNLKVARLMLQVGREHPRKISLLLMSTAGVLASFMRSLGTVSLFLPIVTRINARTGISKAYLLMPMAFCAILGGSLTMVGSSPLIILNSVLKNSYSYMDNRNFTFEPFRLFDVMPIGLMLLISGIIYWFFANSKITDEIRSTNIGTTSTKSHFKNTYAKGVDIFELKITAKSTIIDQTEKDLELKLGPSCSILAIKDNKETYFPPLRKTILTQHATIAIMGDKDTIQEFAKEYKLTLASKLNVFAELLHPVRSGLSEVVIPPSSQLIGAEVNTLHMKRNHKLHVLAMYRDNAVHQGEELQKLTLRSGDTLGIFGLWEALQEFQKNPDFVVITSSFPREKVYPAKMPQALFFFVTAILLVAFGTFSISVGLLLGAIGMIVTGVLTIDQAYDSVSWKTVFLLAGLIPLGLVMQTSGTADWISKIALIHGTNMPTWAILSILTIASTTLALLISNIGAAILLIPIAIELALSTGVNPKIYAITVALAASNTFLIPTHQVNALIAGPGGYSGKKFLVFGSIMTFIYWVVMLLGIKIMF